MTPTDVVFVSSSRWSSPQAQPDDRNAELQRQLPSEARRAVAEHLVASGAAQWAGEKEAPTGHQVVGGKFDSEFDSERLIQSC